MKPKKNNVAVERIKKQSILTSSGEQEYDYEKFKFKVAYIGDEVTDRDLVGKIILKQENLGVRIEYLAKEYIIISEDNILAEI